MDSVVARGSSTTASITVGDLTASGFSAGGHYIPTDDALYDIGSADKQIRDIYVSTGSIIFGGEHRIEINPTTETFNLDIATTKGLSIPTVSALDSLDYPDGTIVYHKSLNRFKFRQNSQWIELGSGGAGGGDVAISMGGIGILTIADDGSGPNRQLLVEYAANPTDYSGKTLYVSNLQSNPPSPFVIDS